MEKAITSYTTEQLEEILKEKTSALKKLERELAIEEALEKVRARTMAMQKSDELSETAVLLFQQLRSLGFDLRGCGFNIWEKNEKICTAWMSGPEGTLSPPFNLPLTEDPLFIRYYESRQNGEDFWVYETGKEELAARYKYLQTLPILGDLIAKDRKDGMEIELPPFVVDHAVNFSNGNLIIVTHKRHPEAWDIFKRFGKVFEQTYTRFLDLKKAEAQVREATIEASLERVRAKTMAMYKSADLLEVIPILAEQFQILGFTIDSINVNTNYRDKDWHLWLYNPGIPMYTDQLHIPYFDHPFFNRTIESINKGSDFTAFVFTKEEKDGFLRHLYSHTAAANAPEERKKFNYDRPGFAWSCVYSNHTALTIANYNAEPYTEEQNGVLRRFGKVIEQCYIRFLDLQKAEAQAREAQIQLALERVRARTMAMQKSDELKYAATLLFQQVKALGVPAYSCGYNIWAKGEKQFTSWMSTQDGTDINGVPNIPLTEDANFIRYVESKEKGEPFFVLELRGERMQEHYQYLKTIPAFKSYFDYAESVGFNLPETQIHYLANFSHGNLLFITLEPCPAFHDVFKRFAAVFEQTYTRFLDLQKSEAQAREAKIEAVLERVRSRTMAMQKSDELTDVAALLFEQVGALGIKTWTAGFNVWSEDNNSYVDYITSPNGGFIKPYTVYTEKAEALKDISNARKSGVEFDVQYVEGEKIKELYLALSNLDEKMYEKMLRDGVSFPSHQYEHFVFGSKVSLMFITYEPVPEAHDIFKRLGKVFEQTYTRFLDLKRAEAQAREAQIEAALERVRSRTMAMHQSKEIADIGGKIFSELRQLDLVLNRVLIWIFNDGEKYINWWSANPEIEGSVESYRIDYNEQPVFLSYLQAWKNRVPLHLYSLSGDNKKNWEDHLFSNTELSKLPVAVRKGMREEGTIFTTSTISDYGLMMVGSFEPLSAENIDIIQRFGRVFQQSYTRYLDVQKAEAQAREAQIELGLERVRARAMAMQTSEELNALVGTLFTELTKLDLVLTRCVVMIFDPKTNDARWLMANSEAPDQPMSFLVKYHTYPPNLAYVKAWQERSVKWEYLLQAETKKEWDDFIFSKTELSLLPDFVIAGMRAPDKVYLNASFASFGNITLASLEPLSEEHFNILIRFASVFDLTYTRFNDLKQAEIQAREAQIEAALERVRSSSLAMHKSEDIQHVVHELYTRLLELNVHLDAANILFFKEGSKDIECWTGNNLSNYQQATFPYADHAFLRELNEAHENGQEFFKGFYTKEQKDAIFKYFFEKTELKVVPEERKKFVFSGLHHACSMALVQNVGVNLNRYFEGPFSDEEDSILKRFAKVFHQAYTRFLDLQKAEAQAREAKIEAALERVRSKTMAMQRSEDLSETAFVLFQQLKELGEHPERIFIATFDEQQPGLIDIWGTNQGGKQLDKLFKVSADELSVISKIDKALKEKKKSIVIDLKGKELAEYVQFLKNTGIPVTDGVMTERRVQTIACFSKGVIGLTTPEPHPQESIHLLERFAGVFDLTYTRFLDLQKAEAQAREATIEAALEKVRGKAMAMRTSNDLSVTASMVFTELRRLGINPIRCGVGLLSKETRKAQLYSATSSAEGDSLSLVGWVMLSDHAVLTNIYDTWLRNEEYYPELNGEQLKSYYELLLSGLSVPMPEDTGRKQYGTFLPFSVGCLYAWSDTPYNEEEIKVLKRFATIIDLTFRRYIDLQKSEANAREAVKQATLDRVRAEIASMRTVNDLDRITPLIWNELTVLGIPFIRCGVFIMDEHQHLIHTFLSTPDGKAIGAFHLPYDTPGNIEKVLSHWHSKKIYTDHWDEASFVEFAAILVKQGTISSTDQYLNTIPHGGFSLHFLPFLQGMLYVGNTTQLNDDDIKLIQSVADAFSTAYARYEDFNKLEAAKQQVDSTLKELQATQKQLIQSEKMASLGELTAGIAHEIQNPLNFVNNFSEVSNELIDELRIKNEKLKIEDEEVSELLNDIQQNLEKINHHGKRADAIVKGMLQHSRSTSGQKEPTDINALADEYLRLAYHGLRAKDKSFNANMKTDFDNSVGNINIISQDIGRVLLNLYNNAFYAVHEKKKLQLKNYDPTVSVTTKKQNDRIEIIVKDNGNGIPQKIVDKIFQPFFTTKPTGQGTGLGLSLSYDIIKAHGGEIKVETKEGDGSTFKIELLLNTSK